MAVLLPVVVYITSHLPLNCHRLLRAPSRAMTPAEQLDIIRSFQEVESLDEEKLSKRDLEVSVYRISTS